MAGGILLAVLLGGRVPRTQVWLRMVLIAVVITPVLIVGISYELQARVSRTAVLIGCPVIALSCTVIVFAVVGMELQQQTLRYLG